MGYAYTTEAERQKIKTLCNLGISVSEIHKITGRSYDLITRIKTGTYEEMRVKDRERMRKRSMQTKNPVAAANEEVLDNVIATVQAQKTDEEQKRQETRRRIREEAEKAGAPRFDDEQIPEKPKTLASPFSYDSLLMRIADSNDYTNALLNGVLNRLEALCKALGVIE
jgi:hypothetical protein